MREKVETVVRDVLRPLIEADGGAIEVVDVDDGVVTVDEVYSYVSTHVPSVTGQNQHPMKKGEVEGQLILGRVR